MHMLSHTHPLLEQRYCSGISDLVKESYTTLQGISRNPDIAVDLHKQFPRQRPACCVRYVAHCYMTCNYAADPISQQCLHTNRVKTGEDCINLLLTVRVDSLRPKKCHRFCVCTTGTMSREANPRPTQRVTTVLLCSNAVTTVGVRTASGRTHLR